MKNAHKGLASRLDMARERISQAGNMSMETSHIDLQKEKKECKKGECPGTDNDKR